jgi:hypothetical protein
LFERRQALCLFSTKVWLGVLLVLGVLALIVWLLRIKKPKRAV